MFPVFYQRSRELFHQLDELPIVQHFLIPLEEHHADSRLHSRRTSILAIDLGYSLGLPEEQIYELGLAAMFHDVGKKGVSYCLLEKDGKLSDHEWLAMKAHVRLGFCELQRLQGKVPARVPKIQVAHHEYQGERSYPRSKKDRRLIPRFNCPERRRHDTTAETLAQMLAAADVYDALSSPRAYKPGLPWQHIAQLLHQDYTGNKHYVHEVLRRGIMEHTPGLLKPDEILGRN